MAEFSSPRFVIVGAGVAGLACFERLVENGTCTANEVLLLEVCQRVACLDVPDLIGPFRERLAAATPVRNTSPTHA